MDKYTGKRLDARYEIQELIGVGGMSVVYRAYDVIEDKIVAIKILKDEFLGNKEFVKRFKNESKAIAVLSHKNIVKVYDVSFGTKIQYIVMEYIDGITLKEYISQKKVLKWEDTIYFTKQILSALKHAHSKGVIHRDIKPQNIMLLKDGKIKVTDFGIARFSRNETQTMTDRAIGSVHYISPEQAKGNVIDEKADIYSVGVMLYEMLTGSLPFEADNAVSVAIMQMQATPKPLREINPEIPEGLEQITLKAMQKNPLNRYETAQDMMEDLKKLEENPETKFEYKYFVDDDPTKFVESNDEYSDEYEKHQEEKKKVKTGVIIGGITAALGIFAIVCVFIALLNSCSGNKLKDVEIPNFIGMKLSDVQNNPSYKFVWKIESVYDSSKEEGVILDQDPLPGSKKVKEGSTISLKVNSSGVLVTVPALKGMTEEVAKGKITNLGLKYEIISINDSEVPEGLVCTVDPREGTKVSADTTIKLYISKGPKEEKITVPQVLDKPVSIAKSDITNAGLKVDTITYEDSEKAKDTVISTDPLPNRKVSKDTKVKLTVSSGKKTVKISVDLPKNVDYQVKISCYVDGELKNQSARVPAYNSNYTFELKGLEGKKKVHVDIDGSPYRVYEVDFDASSNNLKTIQSYEYKNKNKNINDDVLDDVDEDDYFN